MRLNMTMKNTNILSRIFMSGICLLVLLFASGFTVCQGKVLIADSGSQDKSDDKDESKKEKEPIPSVTDHSILIDGRKIEYQATAGYMVLKDFSEKKDSSKKKDDSSKDDKEPHKARAKVFFVAYTKKNVSDRSSRPVCFSFNGGPGSASIWLHMGALGPRRTAMSEDGEALPPPYRLEDNSYSWLDKTDLVFIDPVSTGFSRTEPDESPKSFHGFKADIESVGEFIRLYLTKNKRWSSPKFIVGESYGTTRAAGLSNYLQERHGIYLNGIVLVSSVLNFSTLDFAPNNDLPYILFLPSYAATAWYHKKLPSELQSKPLPEVLAEVEKFASEKYLLSLFKGDQLNRAESQELSNQLASYTGIPEAAIAKLNNRIKAYLFFTRLLMDSDRKVGRYDSRITGLRYYPGTDWHDYDPSYESVKGPFTATFNDYVRSELSFKSELPYETIASVRPWKYKKAKNRYLNVAEDLRKAMTRNPYLKVMICSGYYDLATPYFASKYTVDQMFLKPSIRKNVSLTFYKGGHMMYACSEALAKLKSDFAGFLDQSILSDSQVVRTAKP